jgi:lysozyme family protein
VSDDDLLDRLIDQIAEAVVQKIDERRKIDLIAEAVLARLEARSEAAGPVAEGPVAEVARLRARAEEDEREPEPAPRPARRQTGKRATRKK